MSFDGFPKETLTYLKALNANNDKAWFEANRKAYEIDYLAPALALIEALSPFAATLDPPHQAVPKLNKSLRRIHRDTRFSKDKTPYQPRIHIVLWTGDHPNRSAGIHLVLAHDHFGYGSGHWAFEKEALERYRHAVLSPSIREELVAALKQAAEVNCLPGDPELSRLPRIDGIDPTKVDLETAELLKRKGLVARTHHVKGHDKRLFGKDALTYIRAICEELTPLDRWIQRHVEARA